MDPRVKILRNGNLSKGAPRRYLSSFQILAKNAEVGRKYLSRTNIPVIIKAKDAARVIVKSLATGNNVIISSEYLLRPVHSWKEVATR